MASVVTLGRNTGKKRKQYPRAVDFVWPKGVERPEGVGRRPRIYLGVVSQEDAEYVCGMVECLLASRVLNQSPRPEVSAWLTGISDDLYAKLAGFRLCQAREPSAQNAPIRLRQACARFLRHKRPDLKPRTLDLYRQTIRRLSQHFNDNPPIACIRASQATDWRARLKSQGLQEATVRLHCRNAKAIFNAAVEDELIAANPFRKLKSRSVAAERDHLIDAGTAEQVLAELPDAQWRLLFGLARYAGLRIPSESHLLTWSDIDRDRGRLRVYAPKTDSIRSVPISPRLDRLIQDAWEAIPEREPRVLTLSANNLHRTLRAAIQRAGLEVWPDLFQALRRSCETELANRGVPQHAVSAWIGHSEQVSREHYLQVTDDLYALVITPKTDATAQQNTQQQDGAPIGRGSQRDPTDTCEAVTDRADAAACEAIQSNAEPGGAAITDYESPALTAELRGRGSGGDRSGQVYSGGCRGRGGRGSPRTRGGQGRRQKRSRRGRFACAGSGQTGPRCACPGRVGGPISGSRR